MEIERKFLINSFPNLPEISHARTFQGYIATDPVVRIRKRIFSNFTEDYILCFKGEGQLVREEIELAITKEMYEKLSVLLKAAPIEKDYRVYSLEHGLKLECSLVEPNSSDAFLYAEIEFPDVESANAFVPPSFLGSEITYNSQYSMSHLWKEKITRLNML